MMFFICLNCPLTFYLLDNCVYWGIDLFLTLLVCMCTVQGPQTDQILGIEHRVGRLFEILPLYLSTFRVSVVASSSPPSIALWHLRLGHASVSQVQVLASKGLLGLMSTSSFDCISCQLGNNHIVFQ
jgi:hypothetical protein